jgi:hypothetical protein
MPAPEHIINELKAAYSGVVEEWERQRADNPDWVFPDYRTASGLGWWLRSEVDMVTDFTDEPSDTDKAIAEFCMKALEQVTCSPSLKGRGFSRPAGESIRGGTDTCSTGSALRDGPARPEPSREAAAWSEEHA